MISRLTCKALAECFIVCLALASGPVFADEPADEPLLLFLAYNYATVYSPGGVRATEGSPATSHSYVVDDPVLYSILYPEDKTSEGSRTSIDEWREYVYAKLRDFPRPLQIGPGSCKGAPCAGEESDTGDKKKIERMALGETLKFTEKRVPVVYDFIHYFKLEVSNKTYKENAAGSEAEASQEENRPGGPSARQDKKEGLALKAGMRLKLEEGSPAFVAETEARYKTVTSLYRMDLDKRNRSSLIFKYPVGTNAHLQFNHDITQTADPTTGEKIQDRTRQNLVQLIFHF